MFLTYFEDKLKQKFSFFKVRAREKRLNQGKKVLLTPFTHTKTHQSRIKCIKNPFTSPLHQNNCRYHAAGTSHTGSPFSRAASLMAAS